MTDNAAPLILLTRPRPAGERFAAACRTELGEGVEILLAPLQQIAEVGPLPGIPDDAALIFTSENGALSYAAQGGRRGLTAYCVGDRTAEAASAAGLEAVSADGAIDDLRALILRAPAKGPLLHLHGRHVTGDLSGQLRAAGLRASGHVVYEQRDLRLSDEARDALTGPRRVVAPVFSPRSARLLARAAPDMRNTVLPCISEATRAALPEALRPHGTISDRPDAAAMLIAVARQLCP